MQQTKKLQSYMTTSNAGQQQIELVKASQCLSELGTRERQNDHFCNAFTSLADHFTVDADFTGIDVVEKDLQIAFKARHDIQSQAQDVLENGLQHLVVIHWRDYHQSRSSTWSLESGADRNGITGLFQSWHFGRSSSAYRTTTAERFSNTRQQFSRSQTTIEE
jgi:hypothetical protein